jgi:hypothetical protein
MGEAVLHPVLPTSREHDSPGRYVDSLPRPSNLFLFISNGPLFVFPNMTLNQLLVFPHMTLLWAADPSREKLPRSREVGRTEILEACLCRPSISYSTLVECHMRSSGLLTFSRFDSRLYFDLTQPLRRGQKRRDHEIVVR